MPATIACPKCQTKYKLPDSALGKAIKCQKCGASFRTQAPQGQPSAPSERANPQPSPQELAQYGIDGPLKRQADIFSAPPLSRQANPLGNFVLEDPGFADVDRARQEVREETGASDGMESILNNPYAAPGAHGGKKISRKDQLEAYSKPTLVSLLFSFEGRIPRRVFWAVWLIKQAVIPVVVFLPLMLLGFLIPMSDADPGGEPAVLSMIAIIGLVVFGVLMSAISIVFTWIAVATQVKRWHDVDKSGWWFLIGFIPIIGPIWVLVEVGCMRGTVGPNTYGPDPT